MSSKITIVIDKLREIIPTLTGFTDKLELHNPYLVQDNASVRLAKGWGLTIEDSGPGGNDTYGTHSESRSFGIVVTKSFFAKDNDPVAIHTAGKALLEDAKTVVIRLLNDDQLGIEPSIGAVTFLNNTGVSVEFKEKGKFLTTKSIISIDINEDI